MPRMLLVARLAEAVTPATGATARCCTSQRHKTRVTHVCEVIYSWHPWCGLKVVCQSVAKNEAVFRCATQTEMQVRQLEIPQWMFDRVRCCLMRLSPQPVVGIADLRAMQLLLRHLGAACVVEDQHPSSASKGDADAQGTSSPANGTVGPVSSASPEANLGGAASTGRASSQGIARTPAARAVRTSRASRRQGGQP